MTMEKNLSQVVVEHYRPTPQCNIWGPGVLGGEAGDVVLRIAMGKRQAHRRERGRKGEHRKNSKIELSGERL